MNRSIRIKDYGIISYQEAFNEQLKLHASRINNRIPDTIMLLEHPHVFTLGRHANEGNIIWDTEKLNSQKVKVIQVVEWVEKIIIQSLNHYGISGHIDPEHPGVWVDNAKICAIGMRIREDVSYHGFALNVSTDLSYFDGIVPCGIKNKSVCSLSSVLGRKIDIEEVKKILAAEALSAP